MPMEPLVEVAHMSASKQSWLATGSLQFHETDFCPSCGQAVQVLRQLIPVEIAEYACPQCDRTDALRYEIQAVDKDTEPSTYTFSAVVECTRCRRRRSIKEALRGILSIKKIKVSLLGTGVELERS
jgi:ribosomal protein L37AE/L43A